MVVEDLTTLQADSSPFRPHFGVQPRTIVGRESILRTIGTGLVSGPTHHHYTSLLVGRRGTGKTVTLNAVEDMAALAGWVVLSLDAATPGISERIKSAIAMADSAYESLELVNENLRRATETRAGIFLGPLTGSLAWQRFRESNTNMDLREHLAFMARSALQADTSVLVTIDELHGVDPLEGRRLANDLQHVTKREGLPLAFVGAGLPDMRLTLMRDKKMTFFHRCEDFDLIPLTFEDCVEGLYRPICDAGGSISKEALWAAADYAQGMPYKLQVVGDQLWRISGSPEHEITLEHVEISAMSVESIIDKRIGVPAWYDLSQELQDVLAVVSFAECQVSSSDVADKIGITQRTAHKAADDLVTLGYLSRARRDRYATTGFVSSKVLEQAWAGLETDHRKDIPDSSAAPQTVRCGKWMPRAQARCRLSVEHAGRCRSRTM